jgi:hypothetical protein
MSEVEKAVAFLRRELQANNRREQITLILKPGQQPPAIRDELREFIKVLPTPEVRRLRR